MAALTIIRPLPIAQMQGSAINPGNVFTWDPREAWIVPADGNNYLVDIDFGGPVAFDSFYFGYHNAAPNATWAIQGCSSFGQPTSAIIANQPLLSPYAQTAPFHASGRLSQPLVMRYVRMFVTNPVGNLPLTIGIFAVGLAFQPRFGHEYGAGRPIIDLGSAQRLRDGGFGIDEGAVVGGYQWQFGDIQPDELAKLYALLKDRGNTGPVVVIEDPDQSVGINERTHWGLLTKISPYERLDPKRTRYALQMEDWL